MIKFTVNAQPAYINPNLITYIRPGTITTQIFLGSDQHYVVVDQSEDEVVAKLYGAELDSYTRTGTFSRL